MSPVLVALLIAATVAGGIYFAYKLLGRPPPPRRASRDPPNIVWSVARTAIRGATASHACWGFDRGADVVRTPCE